LQSDVKHRAYSLYLKVNSFEKLSKHGSSFGQKVNDDNHLNPEGVVAVGHKNHIIQVPIGGLCIAISSTSHAKPYLYCCGHYTTRHGLQQKRHSQHVFYFTTQERGEVNRDTLSLRSQREIMTIT
jgi:hypothetical protein